MPGEPNPAPKRKPPTFKPPRPNTSTTTNTTTKRSSKSSSAPRRKSAPAKPPSYHEPSSSDIEAIDLASSSSEDITAPVSHHHPHHHVDHRHNHSEDGDHDPSLTIPPKLLTRLLHHHFQSEEIRIATDANRLVTKYMETFVREALARAALERSESRSGDGGVADDFLEVSTLRPWEWGKKGL